MAEFLDVNNVTVVNAYKLLEEDFLVYKKVGSGTFISPVSDEGAEEVSENTGISYKYDFSISSPTADLFPVDDFKSVLNEVLDRDKGFAFGYQESKGFMPLRQSLCHYLERHEIYINAEELQVISGAQQGIDLVSKSVLDYGDTVVVESPTYTGAIASFKLKGANIVEVPLLEDGIDLEALAIILKKNRVKLIYLMPNSQNPTGISYSDEKKVALLELVKQHNIWVLEDDYTTDLNYGTTTPKALKAYDQYEKTIYIKSFSKVLMPGLRLGFMIVPSQLADAISMAKHSADISTSGLIQRSFDLYIRKGHWDTQMKIMNQTFMKRFIAMKQALERHCVEDVWYYLPTGGYNFWLTLPAGYNADELAWRLNAVSVAIVPGSVFYHTQIKSASFRLSMAGIDENEIETGIILIMKEIEAWKNTKQTTRFENSKPVL
jgi:DNA-binding transcriptional MocR family regulator